MDSTDGSLPLPSGTENGTPGAGKGRLTREEVTAKGRASTARAHAIAREKREAGERSRYQLFLAGELQISDMDNEELSRGQFRGLADTSHGSNIQKYTAKTHSDMKRELLLRGQKSLDKMYLDALKVLADIAQSDAAEDKDRLKAVTIIMERVAGKVPDRVEVGGADAFSDVLAGIVDDAVVEGEVVSESESDYSA